MAQIFASWRKWFALWWKQFALWWKLFASWWKRLHRGGNSLRCGGNSLRCDANCLRRDANGLRFWSEYIYIFFGLDWVENIFLMLAEISHRILLTFTISYYSNFNISMKYLKFQIPIIKGNLSILQWTISFLILMI